MLRPEVWFIPRHHADPDDYWTGLGVIAMIDAIRLSVAPDRTAMYLWIIPLAFLVSLHINRLRDAARPFMLLIVGIGTAIVAKAITALIGMTAALYPIYLEFLSGQGVDLEDPLSIQQAAQNSELMNIFQEQLLNNADTYYQMIFSASAWTSMIGFWVVMAMFSLWYGRMGQGRAI